MKVSVSKQRDKKAQTIEMREIEYLSVNCDPVKNATLISWQRGEVGGGGGGAAAG
jgi:hypothetical protein